MRLGRGRWNEDQCAEGVQFTDLLRNGNVDYCKTAESSSRIGYHVCLVLRTLPVGYDRTYFVLVAFTETCRHLYSRIKWLCKALWCVSSVLGIARCQMCSWCTYTESWLYFRLHVSISIFLARSCRLVVSMFVQLINRPRMDSDLKTNNVSLSAYWQYWVEYRSRNYLSSCCGCKCDVSQAV